jgi:hypothetical protein
MKRFLQLLPCFFALSLFSQKQNPSDSFPIEKSVFNIFLAEKKTLTKVLGINAWDKQFEADSMFPRIECLNKNKTEGLRLFFHYGGVKNSVAEFELFLTGGNYIKPAKAYALRITRFRTGKGIVLGLTKNQVIAILGKNGKHKKGLSGDELSYYTNNPNTSVLKVYNAVAYFIKCKFSKGKLIKYNFGFEYP